MLLEVLLELTGLCERGWGDGVSAWKLTMRNTATPQTTRTSKSSFRAGNKRLVSFKHQKRGEGDPQASPSLQVSGHLLRPVIRVCPPIARARAITAFCERFATPRTPTRIGRLMIPYSTVNTGPIVIATVRTRRHFVRETIRHNLPTCLTCTPNRRRFWRGRWRRWGDHLLRMPFTPLTR